MWTSLKFFCYFDSFQQRKPKPTVNHHTHNRFTAFFQDYPGEPVPKENFWTLWCKERLTEADSSTIRLGATPSGLTSAHLHHSSHFLQAGCPCCCPTNSVNALKANKSTVNYKNDHMSHVYCVSLYRNVVHNTAQNTSDNLPSYPPDSHHSSGVVYWRRLILNTCKVSER